MSLQIVIEDLSIGYTDTKQPHVVAENLNTTLNKGEMTCLLGANGRGKSTLMKTMCGFLRPLKGQVLLDGVKMSSLSEKELATKISVVLTEKIAIMHATVYELVALGRSPFTGFLGRLTTADKAKANEAIDLCGMSHKRHSLLSSLSDGERQKATIAKALAQDTPYIILDEPTAFLDLPARVEIMQLLRRLASTEHKSILMSTHDLDLALQMSDKLWLLHNDHIKCASPEDLLLTNAFQSMFNKGGVEFDNKTGMFKVQYAHEMTLSVRGHGFEYVLLRRAFARKGISLKQCREAVSLWVEIKNDTTHPYAIMQYDKQLGTYASVEECVAKSIAYVDTMKEQNFTDELVPSI